MALLIGFVDILPILGSGTVMLPWALTLTAINGDLTLAIAITKVLWIIISIVRQLIRTKIVVKQKNRNTPNIYINSNVYWSKINWNYRINNRSNSSYNI